MEPDYLDTFIDEVLGLHHVRMLYGNERVLAAMELQEGVPLSYQIAFMTGSLGECLRSMEKGDHEQAQDLYTKTMETLRAFGDMLNLTEPERAS